MIVRSVSSNPELVLKKQAEGSNKLPILHWAVNAEQRCGVDGEGKAVDRGGAVRRIGR